MKIIFYLSVYIAICACSPVKLFDVDYIDPELSLDNEDFENRVLQNIQEASDTNGYWLFTRKNPTTPQIIINGDMASLSNSNYDSSKPLKVIAHGWTFDGNAPVNTMITAAYLDTDDVNILVLDWGISASGNYVSASIRVPGVGRFLGNFLQWLITNGGGSWDRVHLIGFSLGAHVVGNAGRQVGGQAKRVTGLDPAGPFWGNSFALNKQAGQYVEAIHTNVIFRGVLEPVAHTDFYPNGGLRQPGCDTDSCAHDRAYEFFASSVRTNHFIGKKCSNLLQALFNICNGETLNMGNANLAKTGLKSSLQHIARCTSNARSTPVAFRILKQICYLREQKCKTITLQWIPFHANIIGNEIANTLARIGTYEGVEIFIKPCYSECLHMIKNKCFDLWAEYFDKRSKDKGIWFRTIQFQPLTIPWIDTVSLSRKDIVTALRIRSGIYGLSTESGWPF